MFCTLSVRVGVQNFAIVRHGVSEETNRPRQIEQTLKYLVDFYLLTVIVCASVCVTRTSACVCLYLDVNYKKS